MLQILKICLFTTKDNYPNFFSTYTQLKVSLQMKNENQNKTRLGRKKERKHIVVKKNNNNSIQHTRSWESIRFSFYSKDCVEFCFIVLFMSFIFFLTLEHIYAAASFPPVPVQHEYSHSHYRLQMCTYAHTHITYKDWPLDPWELMWLNNFKTAVKQMLGMILLKQHQENLCLRSVSSHWNNSELIYSEDLTQTSTVTSNHEHSDLKETLESSASKSLTLQTRKSSSKWNCLLIIRW